MGDKRESDRKEPKIIRPKFRRESKVETPNCVFDRRQKCRPGEYEDCPGCEFGASPTDLGGSPSVNITVKGFMHVEEVQVHDFETAHYEPYTTLPGGKAEKYQKKGMGAREFFDKLFWFLK